jgi:hypothetical protein
MFSKNMMEQNLLIILYIHLHYPVSIINVSGGKNGIHKTTRIFVTNRMSIKRILNLVHDLEEIAVFQSASYRESFDGSGQSSTLFLRAEQG